MKRLTVILLTICLLLGVSACGKKEEKKEEVPAEDRTAETIAGEMTIRDYGTVKFELYPQTAPKSVENFVTLAKAGFYEGKTFHRIIDGFMIQGGADPEGKAANIPGEFAANGFENDLKHTEGVLSMARAKNPDSASSQFFVMVGEAPWLDGQYAAFGKVTEGLDIVKKIAADAKPVDDNGTILPEEQPVIESVTILE